MTVATPEEQRLSEQEVLDVLGAVERGEVTIPDGEKQAAQEAYCGDCTFHLSNGWVFVIFNDCDEWDYISEARAPDGRLLRYEDIAGSQPYDPAGPALPALYGYTPPIDRAIDLWGIPV